ncbi:MAG TPA: ABC transporter substrate-binding protein [Burkholderiales bacterium]|jgi:branched-chain amino acid transport system substrate-binding protein|nr:ABC transporter substrate-binding protein [Burkholderiales bacterium]
MLRRTFIASSLLAAIAAGLPPSSQAQPEPIRIGFLTVRSGALAAGGKQMEEGIQLFLKERNNTIAGRKVELVIADTGGNPAQAKTKVQELVERSKVHVVIGPLAAFEAIAIDDYIRQTRTPTVSCSAAAEDLTQRKPNPWFVRTVGTSAQPNHALGEYAAKTLGYKRVAIIADDFAYGHETAAGFQRTFEDNGGKVVQRLLPPLNVPDYGSYIAQIKRDVDAVYAGFAGANGFRFLRQYREYGLKLPVLGSMTTADEGILRQMGDEAIGVVSGGWYSAAIDSPENKRFVAAVNKEYGADPGYYTLGAYSAGALVEAAARALKGKVEDKDAFMKALRNPGTVHDPRGEWKLDEYGNPVMPAYIRKVERRGGKLVNTVVKTYPAVSQFWTYDPKQFLANPVYSRDFPPAKNLEP